MKCVTLLQPFASLVVAGVKRYETRSRRTNFRGPVLIHSSNRFPAELEALCYEPVVARLLKDAGLPVVRHDSAILLPLGQVLGGVVIHDCEPAEVLLAKGAITEDEAAVGGYEAGRFGWRLGNSWRLLRPEKARGNLGLWDLPGDFQAWLDKGHFFGGKHPCA